MNPQNVQVSNALPKKRNSALPIPPPEGRGPLSPQSSGPISDHPTVAVPVGLRSKNSLAPTGSATLTEEPSQRSSSTVTPLAAQSSIER